MSKLRTIKDLFLYIGKRKKWWLAPLLILLILIGALIVFTEGSALAPFIYTLF
jgi:hypothetical protein